MYQQHKKIIVMGYGVEQTGLLIVLQIYDVAYIL